MLEIGILLVVMSPFTALVPTLYMLYKAYKEKMDIRLNPLNVGIGLLFVWTFLSGLFNGDFLSLSASSVLLLYLGMSVFIQNKYNTPEGVDTIVTKVWMFSMIPAVLGIVEKILSFFMDMRWVSQIFWSPSYVPTREAYRIYSTFGNPNIAGTWFAAMFLVSAFLLRRAEKGKRLIPLLGTCLFLCAMVFTGSKGAAIGLELGVFTFALFSRSRKGKIFFATTFVAVIVVALAIPEMNHTLNPRNNIWYECFLLHSHKPLYGWGLFGIFKQTGEIHAHNIIITLLATLGIVGLSIYLGMKLYLFNAIRTLYKEGCSWVPLLASIQALIIGHGLVDFTILVPQGGMLFFGTAAMISALALKAETYPSVPMPDLEVSYNSQTLDTLIERFSNLKDSETELKTVERIPRS